MKSISIRELHLDTGKWVRHAAEHGAIIVTDRGREIAELRAHDGKKKHARLPDREAEIRKRTPILIDSVVFQQEDRDRA